MKKDRYGKSKMIPFIPENERRSQEMIVTDPFGSYTGLVHDPEEKPVQDADDL